MAGPMGSNGALVLMLRTKVRGCIPAEQNPEEQGDLDA